MAARHCPPWADLQPELLGLIRSRLPSLADRVRLGATCRSWRRGARLEPASPPFPWLTLRDGTFLSVPGRETHRIPGFPAAAPLDNYPRCHGSVGNNWLFLGVYNVATGACPMSLANPFSKAVLQLPDADAIWRHEPLREDDAVRIPILYKPPVLLSSPATDGGGGGLSSDSLFAVLITDCAFESVISIFKSSTAAAFRVPRPERISDVALVDGKLYALSPTELFVIEVDESCKAGELKIPSMKFIANAVHNPGCLNKTIAGEEYTCAYWNYLVESGGKLLHVRRLLGYLSTLPNEDKMERSRTISFEVFESDMTADPCVQWRRLDSLGGQALFVGPLSKCVQARQCGAQPDCIYFICDYDWEHSWADPLRDCGVFDMRNGTIAPLLPETRVTRPKGVSPDKFYSARPGWFFPAEAM
ncbi:unnamed protein product [Urochloa humidicola]